MWKSADRVITRLDLAAARRCAEAYAPFSPAWDAAMARVEDIARRLWRFEEADPSRGVSVPAYSGRLALSTQVASTGTLNTKL